MNRSFGLSFVVAALLSFVLSHASAQAPVGSPPPLVPCEDAAEGVPCVAIVTEMSEIAGVWRRFYQGANEMAFSEFRVDGTFSIVQSLPSDGRVSGTVRFEGGVAAFTANPDGPAPPACKEPGMYELRLIRVGDQNVALSFSLMNDDGCVLRVTDFSVPMIAYAGTGEELAMDPDVAARAQPLVPCPEEGADAYPCDVIVTGPADAAGIWKQYVGRPDLQAPNGMGYLRINHDGSFTMADVPEHTVTVFRNYPYGTYAFEGGEVRLSVDAPDVPPICQTALQRMHVYRLGAQPVALLSVAIEDACPPRLQNASLPFIWAAGVE
jgi:hypothetical protein